MIEIKLFRQNKDLIIEGLKKKGFKQLHLVDEIIKLDEDLRGLKTQTENYTSVINTNNTEIGKYIKTDPDKVQNLKTHNSILKEKISTLDELLEDTATIINDKLVQLPNLPHESVELDNGDEATNGNIILRENLTQCTQGKPHWEVIKDLNIVNFELGTKITGAGFPVYIGKGARLQRALIQYFLDYNTNAGYTEYNIPLMVNYDSAYGTGQLPDKEGQMYYAEKDNLYLIPTAEVPLTNIFRDEIVNLPIKMTGHSACFRREAGAYGKEVRGLNRVHQFEKVEIVQLVHPDKSYEVLEEMVLHVENLIKTLELPYRILKLSGTDMSFASALTYDFEVYSVAQDRWLEVSSVTNFETFQSNRMKIRFKEDKKNKLVHTLNGSSLALPRIMACLLENNQTQEGIKIPKALQPYFGAEYLK